MPPFNGYTTQITAPPTGFSTPDRTPDVTVVGTSTVAAPVDIQVEWRLVMWTELTNPPAVYTSEMLGAVSGTPQLIPPPTELSYRTWYYRARTGNKSTNTWGLWTAQQWLNVRPVLGSTAEYIDVNIGITDPPLQGAFAYIDLNVGIDPNAYDDTLVSYVDLNVGIPQIPTAAMAYSDMNVSIERMVRAAFAYTDMDVRSDTTPTPHIWWIRPVQGKEGYIFNIYGHGFGAFQNQYDGKVVLGNFVCPITRWEILPAAILPVTVEVEGTPRATTSTTALPIVMLNAASVTVEAGDIIEYDVRWDGPTGQRLDIFPCFDISGTTDKMGYGSGLLNDTTGDAWISDQPEAYSAWHHRRFVVPVGHYLVGKTISNFGVAWYGFNAGLPVRSGSVRSMVIRQADETPKLWVMGDDHQSTPSLVYTANGGSLVSSAYSQEGVEIDHGVGLSPDTITPEHGWIVAVVPTGAVSSMVRVILEDD